MKRIQITVATFLLAFSFGCVGKRSTAEDSHRYQILLKSRQFTPVQDIKSFVRDVLSSVQPEKYLDGRMHVLLQLNATPSEIEKENLARRGIRLLQYIPNHAWFASIPLDVQANTLSSLNIRWLGPILPEDKMSKRIREQNIGSWARNEDGSVNLIVKYFDDVDHRTAIDRLHAIGINVRVEEEFFHRVGVVIPEHHLRELAKEDFVEWIEEVPPPPVKHDGS